MEECWVAAGTGMESNGEEQNGATQRCDGKNAGRGRYRMGETRRNGAGMVQEHEAMVRRRRMVRRRMVRREERRSWRAHDGQAEWCDGKNAEWWDGKNASRGRYKMGEAKRNGATGRTLGCEERWVAAGIGMESGRYRNGKQKGATQTWCRAQKNAGRGRYRMGELRRNGATGRTQGCGRYKNRKRWRGDAGGTEVMGKARRKSATGRTVDCGKNRKNAWQVEDADG
jgi:hypothetical protein